MPDNKNVIEAGRVNNGPAFDEKLNTKETHHDNHDPKNPIINDGSWEGPGAKK